MSNNASHLEAVRHSLAHLLAAAVAEMYPGTKYTIGPAIENGFYEDLDIPSTVSEEDLPKIEEVMRKKLKTWKKFERREVGVDEARQVFAWNPYKLELIDEFSKDGKQLTLYTSGEFVDLCRGGHVEHAGEINPDAFKLTKVSGAYWRGDQNRQQLQRIYGVAFENPEELKGYLNTVEEAKQRDHRKLGQELDLFTFSDLVGSGLPLYTPRGTVLIEELKSSLREISTDYDMQLVSIPHIAKLELYETSGHAAKFAGELFHVKSHYDQEFVLKPVNCPHHTQIYASRPRSYRDLPIRYIEQTMQYRDEKPGQIGGLQRTRGFTVDDGHTFCGVDQIEQEASALVEIIREFYTRLGLWGQHWVSLSVRDPNSPDSYIGEPADWDKAESMLEEVAKEYDLGAKRMEGEAALYGPKLDFMFKDALGRETQLATVQLDFAMPKRFELSYTDQEGKEQVPVMIHRAILGSFERFMMLLIEHFAGKFPVWLAPEQVRVLTINQEQPVVDFAKNLTITAKKLGLRVTVDDSNESVGKKIRNVELMKVPYSIVIGQKEVESGQVTPRARKDIEVSELHSSLTSEEFLKTVANEAKSRVNKTSL
jgi:threonyl-tRNA synthetase